MKEKNKRPEPINLGEIQNFLLDEGWKRIQGKQFDIPGLNFEEILEFILESNPDNRWCNGKLSSEEMEKLLRGDLYDSRVGREDLLEESRKWGWRRSDYYFTKDETTIFFVVVGKDEEEELLDDWFWCQTTDGEILLMNEHLYFFEDLIQKIKTSEFESIRRQKINEHKQMIKELETLK